MRSGAVVLAPHRRSRRVPLEAAMPLDPYLQAVRDQRLREGVRPLYEMTVAEAREADLASIKADRGEQVPVGEVRELTVAGAEGQLDARLYRPDGASGPLPVVDRKSTRLNSSHVKISYAVFCLKKKKQKRTTQASPTRSPPSSLHISSTQRISLTK